MEIDPIANQPIKIVVVGDRLVGKTCAITKYPYNKVVLLRL